MVTIASGGCNVLSYLTADPAADHRRRPQPRACGADQAEARRGAPAADLRRLLPLLRRGRREGQRRRLPALPPRSRSTPRRARYWEGRGLLGRRRITLFARDLYRHGLLGHFIGAAHLVARLYGADPRKMIAATTLAEQRALLRDGARAALRQAARALADVEEDRRSTASAFRRRSTRRWPRPAAATWRSVLRAAARAARLRLSAVGELFRLAGLRPRLCAEHGAGRCRPICSASISRRSATRAERVEVRQPLRHRALWQAQPAASLDAYVLLDAQDWMTDAQLNALWTRDHPHGAARRPRHLPHRRRADAAARPGRRRHPRPLDLRGGARAARSAPRTAPRSMAASTSTSSTDERA